jgi:hypothetical protein
VELVGVNDVLPQVIWTKYFLEAQGYGIKDSVVYQDNKSAMLYEQNGKASSSKQTWHITSGVFVTDRLAAKEFLLQHCGTKNVVSHYFTKPLQGSAFRKFRAMIMTIDPASSIVVRDHRSVLSPVTNNAGMSTAARTNRLTDDIMDVSQKDLDLEVVNR